MAVPLALPEVFRPKLVLKISSMGLYLLLTLFLILRRQKKEPRTTRVGKPVIDLSHFPIPICACLIVLPTGCLARRKCCQSLRGSVRVSPLATVTASLSI